MPRRPKYSFEVFQAAVDDYRWRCITSTGKVIAVAVEGYRKRHYAEKFVKTLHDFFYITPPDTPGMVSIDESPPPKKRAPRSVQAKTPVPAKRAVASAPKAKRGK